MADRAILAERAPHARDDVVRGRAGRLVDRKAGDRERRVNSHGTVPIPDVESSGPRLTPSAMACSFLQHAIAHGAKGPVTVQPAAFLWPPPPNSVATAPMSTSPFDRMLTRYSSPSACLKNTTAWISFTVSGRLISPSVSS